MASKTSKSTRVRAVPDFSKLHNKWQQKLQTGKACSKKPCTVVHEFDLTQGGAKVERVRTRSMSGKCFNDKTKEEFTADNRALRSIMNNEGLTDRNLTGRATIAGGNQFAKNKTDVRQSEYCGRSKRREYTAAKTRLPTRSTKRKATSPLHTDVNVQKQDIPFEADHKALQSILENKGVSLEEMTSHYCPTNQKPGKDFKTPNGPALKREGLTEARASVYHHVAVDRTSLFTDYKARVLSRLTTGDARSPAVTAKSPGTEIKKDQYRVFEPIRNSMYVRMGGPAPSSTIHPDQVPTSMLKTLKASRVLAATPVKSPAVRGARPSSLKVKKWKDVLGKSQDPVKKTLMFEGENDVANENNAELKKIGDREHRLMKQISNLECKKLERKRQRKDSQSATKSEPTAQDTSKNLVQTVLPSAEQNKKQLELIEQGESKLQAEITAMEKRKQERHQRSPESEDPLPNVQEPPRNPFQQLSTAEIAKRSTNIAPGSDSESEDPSGCQKYPQSPLAKDDACQVIKPNMVSHSMASKVRQTALEGSATKSRSRSWKTKENDVTARSPRCRDLWSPNRGRVEKSPRRVTKVRNAHTPSRSPKASWSKDGPGSPLFSHIMSKVGEQIKKAPLSSVVTNHVKSVEMGMDKENMAPAFLKSDPSPKVYRYTTEDDPMMKDVFNSSMDKLNQSIADITYQFEELENEAQVLGEMSFQESGEVMNNNDILAQLAAIKNKQEELVKKERQLQKQLFRQKYGSPKTKDDEGQPKSAKKRLQMVRVDKDVEEQQIQKSPTNLGGVPEITEKASKLELASKQVKIESVININTAVVASDKRCMDVESLKESVEAVYENIFPTPPLPPRSKMHHILSPEALRPKRPSPKMVLENATFSPKPRMVGPAQLLSCISPHLAAPIQTPLVLRSAALAAKQVTNNICAPGVVTASLQQQNSPIDLSVKSGNSSLNSANSSSTFSPDLTFSYVDKKDLTESTVVSTKISPNISLVPETEPVHFVEPSEPTSMSGLRRTITSSVQTTPAGSSTKFTNTMTTAMSRNTVTMSCDSDILSSQVSAIASAAPVLHGSMSLLANITRNPLTPSRPGVQSYIVATTAQKYYDALMDDEVALFMDRLCTQGNQQFGVAGHGCCNPLASLLENGDDMHFVPICKDAESSLLAVSGSAFASYAGI